MWNSFYGLEMGRRALDYFRQGMETAGHNISNADVDGYSRQRVEASTTTPYTNPAFNRPATAGQVGTGVEVDAIIRLRDTFLDTQYREEVTVQGYWEQVQEALSVVELYVNEPSGDGFITALDDFSSSLQELEKRPDDSSVRAEIVEQTKTLTTYLDQLVRNYDEYRTSLNNEVELMVEDVNTIIDQIAALNTTISQVEGVGGNANDLMDSRDLLADELSKYVDAAVVSSSGDGDYKIDLNGKLLVQGDRTRHLVLVPVTGNEGMYDVQVEDNLFDHVSNPDVLYATVEQGAAEAVHSVEVLRLATESAWSVGAGDSTCPERIKPENTTEALSLSGAFSIQVGSQGTSVASSALSGGVALGAGAAGDTYSFRVSAGNFEQNITVTWDDGAGTWQMSDGTNTAASATGDLTLLDLQGFLTTSFGGELTVSLNTAGTRMTVSSPLDNLISIVDIKGNLVSTLGMENDVPTITIEVTEEDTLETIRNKINSMFSEENGLTESENWLHASIELDEPTNTYYLALESNVAGEAHRINILGDSNGSLQTAKRLGFLEGGGSTSYNEVAQDAAFVFDGSLYLSESNNVKEARKVSVDDDYSASTLSEVCEGIRLELRSVGESSITVRHHIKGGAILGAMEARDDIILGFMDVFDELAYTLANETNALHYAGHGIGENENTTGVEYFNAIAVQYGASRSLSINSDLEADSSLIAAACGDGNGKSNGTGDGSNALRMAQLNQAAVLESDSADFNEFYEAFIADLGAQGQRATAMLTNQEALVNQINTQRQSVMGVNIDEEMMDIIQYQQAFNAISRYITTVDEMLDRIINGMGVVGR